MINVANTTVTLDDLLDLLADRVAARLEGLAGSNGGAAPKGKATKAKAEPEPEDDEDEDDAEEGDDDENVAERRAELNGMRITTLRKMARDDFGFNPDDVNDASKEDLIDNILAEEFGLDGDDEDGDEPDEDEEADEDEADDDEADDEEDEDGEGDEYSREDLEGMSLRELKALAKDAGYALADYKGLDQDGLVDFLLGEDEDADDADEDEPEDEEDEDVEADEEEDADDEDAEDEDDQEWPYTLEDLEAMTLPRLKKIGKDWGVTIPGTIKTVKTAAKYLMEH